MTLKASKAMDMRFHDLKCRESQKQFFSCGVIHTQTMPNTTPNATQPDTTWKNRRNLLSICLNNNEQRETCFCEGVLEILRHAST